MFSTIAGKDFPQLCNEKHSCADRARDGSNAGDFCHCEVIRFVAGRCSLGAILGGDDLEPLSSDLRDRFPPARLIEGGEVFASVVAGILDVVENPRCVASMPLDLRGTEFQRRAPKDAYAVGEAGAANALAVAIPCHRVARKNGVRASYRWAAKRRHALLAREAAQ
jgi:AraC family transcriptional regulator, regulatory protein of adaptative response / methylated-DNA-[protein]-cysteine methyltransferase